LYVYRLNLLNNLANIALMLATSFLWTPPVIWFCVCFLGFATFQVFRRQTLVAAKLATLAAMAVLT
jgi:hypothetical protein